MSIKLPLIDIANATAVIDGVKIVQGEVKVLKDRTVITFKKELFLGAKENITLLKNAFTAKVGDKGFYLGNHDFGLNSCFLTYFKEREDFEYMEFIKLHNTFGVNHGGKSFLTVVTGMPYDFDVKYAKQLDTYSICLNYDLNRIDIYEDIVIELLEVSSNADYKEMAKRYRRYKVEEMGQTLLKDRIKTRPILKEIASLMEIRIRLGWKPVPPTVTEQTLENEPDMFVACDFDNVMRIIDSLVDAGVKGAEICLVGWNKSGHDGRFPDCFPVEEKLGGEEKLKECIKYGQDRGFLMVCHTSSLDCYSISSRFNNGEITIKNKKGETQKNDDPWSGGDMYHLCPVRALEFAKEDLPKIANLGFRGAHYIDVMSIVEPRTCFDKNHPVNARQTLEYYKQIIELAKNEFGGFASEGAFDHYTPYVDYAYNLMFGRKRYSFMDEGVPFWEFVNHGFMLANYSHRLNNYPFKTPDERLYAMRFAGRTTFYYYMNFVDIPFNEVMDRNPIKANTPENAKYTASMVKKAFDDYEKIKDLQFETIEDYEKINEDVCVTTFSNGKKIYVNFGLSDCFVNSSIKIKAKDFIVI